MEIKYVLGKHLKDEDNFDDKDRSIWGVAEVNLTVDVEEQQSKLRERVERCRDYAMRVEENEITAPDILEVLGYSRDGMTDLEAEQALQHKEGE